MKFLLNVGAEKAGTTWLYDYFRNHPEFYDMGKELNIIQRDDLVPLLEDVDEYRKDIESFFRAVSNINQVTGDFTHYEGSSENVFRLIKNGLLKYDIEVVPVYIMRDPIQRSWSAWNSLGGGKVVTKSPASQIVMTNFMSCKYRETIEALDSVFANPLYFFYEDFFTQANIDKICDELQISHHLAECNTKINTSSYKKISNVFLKTFGKSSKNVNAVKYIFERFENVPWKLEDYS
jgi:uncharacterized protein YerC